VNIESKRMQSDTTGWMGSAGTSFSFQKNVQQVLSINANAHVQYKTEKNLYLVLAQYNLLKSYQQELTHNLFYHLRYNYKVNPWLRWEVFTQWQQNSVTNIDRRILAGTGPRFKLHSSDKLKLYVATAAMYEYEKEKPKPAILHRDWRSSSYLSFTWNPNSFIELVSTSFYQPLFRKPRDFRILNQESLNMKWNKHFSFSARWEYLYDAFPSAATPRVNYIISNGINYSF
jgi:hypothetical protein